MNTLSYLTGFCVGLAITYWEYGHGGNPNPYSDLRCAVIVAIGTLSLALDIALHIRARGRRS